MKKLSKKEARRILAYFARATEGTFGAGVRKDIAGMRKTKSCQIRVKGT